MRKFCMSLCNSTLLVVAVVGICFSSADNAPAAQLQKAALPTIVLYTQPGCKSCAAAGDYMTSNRIPFTIKDIVQNPDYLEELSQKYRIRAVPVIVIGNDEKVLRGYVQEAFQQAVRDVLTKQRN
ncbi:MAG: glutaredoxin domain-containing protein [Desulfuromonadaceae bacterium]